MYPILKAKGIGYGVSPYGSLDFCLQALQAGGTCVYRPGWPDCPAGMYTTEPRANARSFMAYAANAANVLKDYDKAYLEPTNECLTIPMPVSQLEWWRDWMIEYTDRAAELGWPKLALPTLSPGNGDALMFFVWRPALLNLKEHGGLFSTHDYTFNSGTGLCDFDIWEANRHQLQHEWMLFYDYEIDITITEAARQSGNAPVDVQDFLCWIGKVQQQPYVHSIWLWLGGYHSAWPNANLDGYYVDIAKGIN